MSKKKTPPVIQFTDVLGQLPEGSGDVLELYMLKKGGLVKVSGSEELYIVSDPVYIQQVMQKDTETYQRRGRYVDYLLRVLGRGLVVHNGSLWRNQRKRIQPQFHPKRIYSFIPLIIAETKQLLDRWEVAAQKNKTLSLNDDIMGLVLNMATHILFSKDFSGEIANTLNAVKIGNRMLRYKFILPDWVPTPANIRFKRALKRLHHNFRELITERSAATNKPDDLLSLLLEAQQQADSDITDEVLMGEMQTFLVTGHETTGNTLLWALYELCRHPEIAEKVYTEVDTLNGRAPELADLDSLPYCRMVIEETLRLYPPLWALIRQTMCETELGDYYIPSEANLFVSTYAAHRNPDYWPEPHRFDPERFSDENKQGRSKFAYIPFGIGPRVCIAGGLAMLQAHIILVMIAQRYRLLIQSFNPVNKDFFVTLKPREQIKVKLLRRGS
ncbi:MAG: hypothetical protein CMF50_10695 [Legionellales bacterium]|nr:hypothetical protein [Legionellales bacterium]|tara:strand:+ start:15614 stop:16942 length:1329 start_codon:yes stop_codon:yes gene_type:complete